MAAPKSPWEMFQVMKKNIVEKTGKAKATGDRIHCSAMNHGEANLCYEIMGIKTYSDRAEAKRVYMLDHQKNASAGGILDPRRM